MTFEEAEKLVDDLIWAARDLERAEYSSGVDARYARGELEFERKRLIAALSSDQRPEKV